MVSEPTEAELLQTWDRGASRGTWRPVIDRAHANGDPTTAAYFQQKLEALPTSLQALAANTALVRKLTGQQWFVIRDAREMGASWESIATALDLTVDDTIAYYQQAIAAQEKYCAPWHDTTRSRAVLPAEGGEQR